MLATRAQALELSMVFSQSLARRRHRPSLLRQAQDEGECPFDNPPARQYLKSYGRIGSFDDLDGPVALTLESIAQLPARVAAISEDMAQPWKPVADGLEQCRCSVAILHIGRMNKDEEHQPECVGGDVALAAPHPEPVEG
jgi:hypothetical protein